MKTSLFLAVLVFLNVSAAEIVEFRVPAGNGKKSWNDQSTPIQAIVGDTIRIFNDDSVEHRLHTFGAPCSHGPVIAPLTSWDCVAKAPYSSTEEGPLYDHGYGPTTEVWIEVQ